MPTSVRRLLALALAFVLVGNSQAEDKKVQEQAEAKISQVVLECCGLVPGDRVVAAKNNPQDATDLPAGTLGTVVCCDPDFPAQPLAISWDDWQEGHDILDSCENPASPEPGPPNSHWWVSCDDVYGVQGLFCGLEPGQRVKVMFDDPNGAESLPRGSTGTVVCYPIDLLSGEVHVAFENWPDGNPIVACALATSFEWPTDSTVWAVPCVDLEPLPEFCEIELGDRVRYLGGGDSFNLPIGNMGTVMCVGIKENYNHDYVLLVSWDGWAEGNNETAPCVVEPDYTAPDKSLYWMRCSEVALIESRDCRFAVGDRVELNVNDPDGASGLPAGTRGEVVCVSHSPDWDYDVLVTWDGWAAGSPVVFGCDDPDSPNMGPSQSHWWMKCEQIDHLTMCTGLKAGDRVVLTAKASAGEGTGPDVGAFGSIVCIDENDLVSPLLVTWDNWYDGVDTTSFCSAEPKPGPHRSHWWVGCSRVAKAACCGFKKGDRVVLRVSDPNNALTSQDAKGLPIGREGTVACCDGDDANLTMLVEWDDFSHPTVETGFCDESALSGFDGHNSWWVPCNALRRADYNGWDFGDFDQSRCTDLQDFLYLLDVYQTHTHLDNFLTLLDYWQVGLRCGN